MKLPFFLFILLATVCCAQKRIGRLSELAHDVSGEVFAINDRTFEIRNFNYDGTGPAAFWWVGKGRPNSGGTMAFVVPGCSTTRLRAFSRATVTVELPKRMTIQDIDYLSVWCEAAAADFGNVAINDASRRGVPKATGNPTCSPSETFPVKEGFNCEQLRTNYQVRWKVNGNAIDFELAAKLNLGYYMGFGVSGEADRTSMVNSDVVIAYEKEKQFKAVDYFLSSRAQCANGKGVCPDETTTANTGKNDITKVTGERNQDLLVVRYTRPIAASDRLDKAFKTKPGEKTFLTWATGPFNSDIELPQIHRGEMAIPMKDVSYEFGRKTANNCQIPLIAEPLKEESKLTPWTRPTFSNETDFTARIGPSGLDRGVAGITRDTSWGIAWYLSPTNTKGKETLIPAIAVERGKKYTFRVLGGDDAKKPGSYHPMYITSDKNGGFATKMPVSRKVETIYAGINITKEDSKGITGFEPLAQGQLCEFKEKSPVNLTKVESFADYYKLLDTSCASKSLTTRELKWEVPKDFKPSVVYYQCVTHRDLGYKLVVFDQGKVDERRLMAESGGGEQSCSAEFNRKTETFDGCAPLGTSIEIFWNIRGTEIETLFVAKSDGWAGISWGNREMVPSNAVIAYKLANGEVKIDDYFLQSQSTAGVQPGTNQKLKDTAAEATSGEIRARFTRPLSSTGIKTLVEGQRTPLTWAIGARPDSGTTLQRHSERGSSEVMLVRGRSTSAGTSGGGFGAIFIAHGVLMALSWTFMVPLAVVAMRFFKKMNPTTFYVHRGVNLTAIVMILIAFIIGVSRGSHSNKRHLAIGVIATILALFQAINGILRPHKDTPKRKPWFLAHAWSGRLALVLAVLNVYFGLILFEVAWYWYLIVSLVFGFFVCFAILLSFLPNKYPISEEHHDLMPNEEGVNQM